MKKAIIAILLILLLGGGGLGGLGYFGMGPAAPYLHKKAPPAEAPVPPKPTETDLAYDLPSFLVPIVKNGEVRHSLAIDVSIRVRRSANTWVASQMPRLESAFTQALYDVTKTHYDVHSAEDRKAVRDRLLWVAEQEMGKGAVYDVTIKSFYER